jgi:phytoene synthase
MQSLEESIFKNGSTTYYWGAKLFPRAIRGDVLRLYSFLRVADDYVDCQPAKGREFRALRKAWEQADRNPDFDPTPQPNDTTDERVIKNIIAVSRKHSFKREWIVSFWDSMQADLEGKAYRTLDDSLWYVHGSAGVVGLMMMIIMRLPEKAQKNAKSQGRAFQWINFIRDLEEDNQLGRCYFPAEDLKKFGLADLKQPTAEANPEAFIAFMHFQINRYREWQAEADKGIKYFPGVGGRGLHAATAMYSWTADQIYADPFVVFRRKVRPGKKRLALSMVRSLLTSR